MRPRRSPPAARSVRLAAPPFAFQRPAGAARAVERVEFSDVLLWQPEVEELGVLGDALTVGRLRDDRDALLDAPARQHLGGSAPVASRDPFRSAAAKLIMAGRRSRHQPATENNEPPANRGFTYLGLTSFGPGAARAHVVARRCDRPGSRCQRGPAAHC